MKVLATSKWARVAAMLIAGLCLSAVGAFASIRPAIGARAASHPAAAASHTATPARHLARHHRLHRHSHDLRAASALPGHVPDPAPAPSPVGRAEHKATLPATLHGQRHSSGQTHKHRQALAPALTPIALTVAVGRAPLELDMLQPAPAGILRSGRAPPRAGPSTDSAVSPLFPRALSFPPAATPPYTRSERWTTVLPSGAIGVSFCALTSPYPPLLKPEQPSGRSRADRPEGAAAWLTMPSS